MTAHTVSVIMATLSVGLIVVGLVSLAQHFKAHSHARHTQHAH